MRTNLQIWHNHPVQSFRVAHRPNAERFPFNCRTFHLVFCRAALSSYRYVSGLTVVMLPQLYAQALCITRNYLNQFSPTIILSTRHLLLLPIKEKIGAHSFPKKWQIYNPIFLLFSMTANIDWDLSCFIEVSVFCKLLHQTGHFLAYFESMYYQTEVPGASTFQHFIFGLSHGPLNRCVFLKHNSKKTLQWMSG